MSKYTNADGLHIRYGLTEGEYSKQTSTTEEPTKWLVVGFKVGQNISSTSATQLAGGRIDAETDVIIPKGSILTQAFFVVDVAFDSGGSATLDLGLSIADGTYTGGDEDGIDVAIAETAIDTAGKVVRCDGALLSATTATSVDLYPSYDVDTAAFTVGEGRLFVEYITPQALGPTTYS